MEGLIGPKFIPPNVLWVCSIATLVQTAESRHFVLQTSPGIWANSQLQEFNIQNSFPFFIFRLHTKLHLQPTSLLRFWVWNMDGPLCPYIKSEPSELTIQKCNNWRLFCCKWQNGCLQVASNDAIFPFLCWYKKCWGIRERSEISRSLGVSRTRSGHLKGVG